MLGMLPDFGLLSVQVYQVPGVFKTTLVLHH